MPSANRRSFLAALGTAVTAGLAGCSALSKRATDVDPRTGLDRDTSAALDDTPVYLAGDASDLPEPPETTDSPADAEFVLATPDTDSGVPSDAFRAGTPVAFAGGDCQTALRGLLEGVRGDVQYGLERVRARPVAVVAAVPADGTVSTYTFVREGGWPEPVLAPLGWVVHGRLPDCRTFVPEHFTDDQYEYAGAAHVAGRLESGETYASQSVASVAEQDDERFVRLRSTLHAAANDGYPIEEAVRETDLPDDQHLHEFFPNPHTQNGVQVRNVSDSSRSTFGVEFRPETDRARGALTGCGGFETEGTLAYDYRASVQWKRERLLETDRHYATATGRGEWRLDA
jgi:hypothetical protein